MADFKVFPDRLDEAQARAKSVEERANWFFDNFENYSRITGRRKLAKATLIAYFTPIWVTFNGELQKDWANVLIVGDTTPAKSETVRARVLPEAVEPPQEVA